MIDVLVCASGADEVQLVSTIAQRLASRARVLRRCVDLTELLALTRAELGDVLLLDVDVEGLSREVVHEIRRGGTGVIAITSPASRTDPATLGITLEAHGSNRKRSTSSSCKPGSRLRIRIRRRGRKIPMERHRQRR